MTREEMKHWLEIELKLWEDECKSKHPIKEALSIVIKDLEQEPVLDKIKEEIFEEKEYAYANFEAYKIDYLMQDEEDVQDSLPQDDFRYGMERAIEIINKYKSKVK